MTFKVDFAKAHDSIRWDFLDDVLHSFGFGLKWRRWVKGCLSSAMASILVNGSPSSEFAIERGLKQGDPLSSYLFIIVMESLNLSFNRVVADGIYSGIIIGTSMKVSHIFYADDVVFLGEWSRNNIQRAGVHPEEVMQAANLIGCSVLKHPFKYLGVMIDNSMSQKLSWASIIQKIQSKLSKWKAKTLSTGKEIMDHCKKRIGNGEQTSFWNDLWIGVQVLRFKYPRLYALENNKSITVAHKMAAEIKGSFRRQVPSGVESGQLENMRDNLGLCSLSLQDDRWYWDLNGDGEFMVKYVRNLLDEAVLPHAGYPTRWVKYIPIKINIFAWKISLDRIPSKINLQKRGVSMEYNLCSICDEDVEDTSHIMFKCEMLLISGAYKLDGADVDVEEYKGYIALFLVCVDQ
nr:RNA-directed DNA polymerase, eukaryota, reverse transcriptase zinc-binding domain protein [Tanacetum cinerariifolium]